MQRLWKQLDITTTVRSYSKPKGQNHSITTLTVQKRKPTHNSTKAGAPFPMCKSKLSDVSSKTFEGPAGMSPSAPWADTRSAETENETEKRALSLILIFGKKLFVSELQAYYIWHSHARMV